MFDAVRQIVGNRYDIVRELGHGGMGIVYLGRDLRREMEVAIKLCGRKNAQGMLWLKREFRSVASLRHPNLVELFELVANDGVCYFTMEYIVGVDPWVWVARPGRAPLGDTSTLAPLAQFAPLRPLVRAGAQAGAAPPEIDFSRARGVLAQLAEAVAFLHARGVIHRDIKPSNVLVSKGTAKLLDFGLALDRRRIEGDLARENKIVGTPAYMAPEYVARQRVSPAMDLYALGVVAFELVTGFTPPQKKGEQIVLPNASRVNPDVPADLEALVGEMLDPNPARRPTAMDVATRLTGAMSQPPSQPRPKRLGERFVGRAPELERIVRQVGDPSPRARVIVVRGPSGAGKTALVDEALGRARIAGVLPELGWRGRCHERELVPYRAFDFIIDDLAAELAGDRTLAGMIEHAGALGRGFPSLGPALGTSLLDDAVDDLRVERERALIAMTQLFDLAIADQRAVVTIDDLQWADDDSIELLAFIVARVSRPLTIIATWSDSSASSERLAAIVERLGGAVEVVALAPMANIELAELIAGVAPAASLEHIRAAIAVAAGSPYLAELIARELGEESGEIDPVHVESRVLRRLTWGERAILDLTAIATSGATFDQLRTLAALPAARITSVLRSLEDARLVKISPSASGEPIYSCYHQRLRDAAHAAIAEDRRRTMHLGFAELGERDHGPPEQLAHHFEHAGERARAAKWAVVAADAARAQLAWGVATDWYARAIELGETRYRQQLAECLFLGGKLAEAAEAYERLADSASDGGERWRVRAAESLIKLGELERGLAVLDGVLERRGKPRARNRITSTARTVGVAARWLLPWRTGAPADDVLVAANRVIASFLSTPYPIEAFEYVLRSVSIAQRAGDRDNHGMGMAMLAVYLGISSLGRFGDRAIASAARSGAPYPRMVAAGAAGILATLRGDWAAMRQSHGEGHRLCMKLGLEKSWEASFLRTYEALGEYFAGEPARAITILDDLAETSDDLFARALIGSYRARALLLDGRLDAARAAERDVAGAPVAKRGLPAIYRQLFAGELALADRDWIRAEAIGNELARHARREWLSAIPAVSAMIDILIATAELGRDDPDAARRALQRARKLERWGRVSFYYVTALRLRAQAELRLGNTAEAQRVLVQAAAAAAQRGSNVDRLAIDRLLGRPVDLGSLAFAVHWSTAGMV
ncbi:MAG: protein kinase [Myxococcota bacterium]|nr:protein kinase [Myxococcota bacterium]